jgi:hypothetical protein
MGCPWQHLIIYSSFRFLKNVFCCGNSWSFVSCRTTVGANVGDSRIGRNPRTYVRRNPRIYTRRNLRMWRQEISENLTSSSKVVNPFTRALGPPFIGRRRDFYIQTLPSNLENISSVKMYINDFYIPWFAGLISYIYKLATSSHFKPGLLRWCIWLGFSLTSEALFINHRSLEFPIEAPWNSWISQVLGLLNFASFQTPKLRRFQVSWTSPVSRLPNFVGSKSPELRQFSDSRTLQVPGLLNFTSFQSSWNRQQICKLKPIWLLLSHIIRRSAKCMKFIRISSWVFPFHETELSILMLIHEYT